MKEYVSTTILENTLTMLFKIFQNLSTICPNILLLGIYPKDVILNMEKFLIPKIFIAALYKFTNFLFSSLAKHAPSTPVNDLPQKLKNPEASKIGFISK